MTNRPHILVCGGCGFIGSNFVHSLARANSDPITVADALTYAGSTDNLEPLLTESRINFVHADIAVAEELAKLRQTPFSLVVNFAAESHVDRSLYHAERFVRTNVLGTQNLLAFCQESGSRFLQISTDEVYGPAADDQSFAETAPLNPTSPYAASKASADLLVLAAIKTHGQDAAIVRTCNNYGPRQYPEKVIPYFLSLIEADAPLPVYGDGRQRRSWLYVDDFCEALRYLLDDFPTGEVVNIGSAAECSNLELVDELLQLTSGTSKIKFVEDRPAHDRRYSIDSAKFEQRYGALPHRPLAEGLNETVEWYRSNRSIFERLKSADAADFRSLHYGQR